MRHVRLCARERIGAEVAHSRVSEMPGMFEDEAAAKQMADIGLPNAPQAPGATFRAAEVREVVAQL